MGWWPSFLGGSGSANPLDTLDPKLREFLEKESPSQFSSQLTTSHPQRSSQSAVSPPLAPKQQEDSTVPTASLYKDGRYAHLWKNYQPLEQVESENASDHDRLSDVLEAFKERKLAVGKAALENCAIQQEEWVNCLKDGKWEDRLQMCRHQVQRFERCYNMQSVKLTSLPTTYVEYTKIDSLTSDF